MVDPADDDAQGGDAQDVAEVFDEDNTNIEARRQNGREDAEQFEDLPDVYDSTRAEGDDSEDDQDSEDEFDDETEDEGQDSDPRDRDPSPDDDQPDDSDIDGLERPDPNEVELEYVGDLTDVANAGSGAAAMESDTLSDDDLRELHYKDDA